MLIAALSTWTWKMSIFHQPRCPTDERIKKLWYIYTVEYYSSHKKECIWVRSNVTDEPGVYYTEWSKSKREKQISYINAYIWNLERWYCWTYLQGGNGDVDRDLWTHWGNSMETHALSHAKQPAGICCNSESADQRSVTPETVGWVGSEREAPKGGDVCIPVADSCCMAETNTL